MLRGGKGNLCVVMSKVDSRGRLTLPQPVRQFLGAAPGSRLAFTPKSSGSYVVSVVIDEDQVPCVAEPVETRSRGNFPPVVDTTRELIRKGHLIPAADFQSLIGWSTRSAVWKALASKRVFAMEFGAKRYFPTFFCEHSYDRRHLEEVTKQLGNLPGGAKFQFFVARKCSLGGMTVLDAIAAGQLEKVLRLAAAYAEA